MDLNPELEHIATIVVDAAVRVHSTLGPGLLERVYESAMVLELQASGLTVQRQVQVPIYYRGQELGDPLRIDLLVEEQVILEIKAVEALLPVHKAQLLTYLKLSEKRLGFLLNFNVPLMKSGLQRIVL